MAFSLSLARLSTIDAHGPSIVFFSLLSVSVTREPRFLPHNLGHLGRVVIDTHL